MIYIVSFGLSIYFMRKAYYADDDRSIRFYLVISALVLIALATLRDESVGTDTMGYQYVLYKKAISAKFTSFMSVYAQNIEVIYTALTFFISKTQRLYAVFFVNASILVFFMFKSIWYYKDTVRPDFSLACYLFCYYPISLSIVRQSIAMAIVLYAITLMDEKKYIVSLFFVILATGFHSTAIVGVGILLIHMFCQGVMKNIITGIIAFVGIIVCFYFRQIIMLMSSILPFFKSRYISDDTLYSVSGETFHASRFMYCIIVLIICLAVRKAFFSSSNIYNTLSASQVIDSKYKFWVCMSLISVIGVLIGGQAGHLYRISWYSEIFSIFLLPQIFVLFRDDNVNRLISRFIYYGALIGYSIFSFVIKTGHGLWPYILQDNFKM